MYLNPYSCFQTGAFMNNIRFSNFEVKWKGDHQIFPAHPFRHLIKTYMFNVHYTCYTFFNAFKKNRFYSDFFNRSIPIPAQKVSPFRFSFRFRDYGNIYFRFRLKICSGSFTTPHRSTIALKLSVFYRTRKYFP